MTILVLILNLSVTPLQMQEFPTRDTCQMAKDYIMGKVPHGTVRAASCVGG